MKSTNLLSLFTTFIVAASTFSLSHTSLSAQEAKTPTAKLIKMDVSAGYDKDNENLKNMMFFNSSPETKFNYLVEAKNIVQVLDESLTIKGNVNPKNWKCGSFPKISDSSNALLFTVEHNGDLTKKIKALKFNGTVDIQTGTKLIKKDFVINEFNTPTSIGKFEIVMTKDKLKVTGKHENIKALTVTLKGKEIKNFSRSWSSNSKTYDFEGIDKGANVSISYWQGLETKSISFSY